MAVTLKLARRGKKKEPHYRIVATEKLGRRDGRFIEVLGYYAPAAETPTLELKEDRVKQWVGTGAQTTRVVRDLINKKFPGLLQQREESQRAKIRKLRARRKERAKARDAR